MAADLFDWLNLAGSVTNAGAGIYGSIKAADAASDASAQNAQVQMDMLDEQLGFLRESRDIGLELQQPYQQAGRLALGDIANYYAQQDGPQAGFNPNYGGARFDMARRFDSDYGDQQLNLQQPGQFNPGAQFTRANNFQFSPDLMNTAGRQYTQANPFSYSRDLTGQRGFGYSDDLMGQRNFGYSPDVQQAMSLGRFTGEDLEDDPGYQFRMAEGLKAIERANAGAGLTGSGRASKDMQRFAQGLASQEYGQAYGRFRDRYQTGVEDAMRRAGLQTQTEQFGLADAAQRAGLQTQMEQFGLSDAARRAGLQTQDQQFAMQDLQDRFARGEASMGRVAGLQGQQYQFNMQDLMDRYNREQGIYNTQRQAGLDLYNYQAQERAFGYGADMDTYNTAMQDLQRRYGVRLDMFNSQQQQNQNYLNNLYQLVGAGQTSAGQASNTAMQAGTGMASATQGAANQIGAGTLNAGDAQANAWLTGAGAVNNAVQGGLQNYIQRYYPAPQVVVRS